MRHVVAHFNAVPVSEVPSAFVLDASSGSTLEVITAVRVDVILKRLDANSRIPRAPDAAFLQVP